MATAVIASNSMLMSHYDWEVGKRAMSAAPAKPAKRLHRQQLMTFACTQTQRDDEGQPRDDSGIGHLGKEESRNQVDGSCGDIAFTRDHMDPQTWTSQNPHSPLSQVFDSSRQSHGHAPCHAEATWLILLGSAGTLRCRRSYRLRRRNDGSSLANRA